MRDSGRWRIHVKGTVQGVGFRPFVYRSAMEAGLSGHVCNTGEGVAIEIEGTADTRDRFLDRLQHDLPPLARIQELAAEEIAPVGTSGFAIRASRSDGPTDAQISPDVAPCEDCLRELADPGDRRHRYPFINCTNCGPRYTIVEALPYDRPKTTMKAFEMCPACALEYADPLDRRFHAQPDACAECGPRLTFVRSRDREIMGSSNLIEEARAALCGGEIVAIKGIGGFHLACDATNDAAVSELRRRKRRDEKPFAIMVADLEATRKLCHCSEEEVRLLSSPERPIVLLRRREGSRIAPSVAPGNRNLGVMLPSSPLHHLLLHELRSPVTGHRSRVLVMTSGNITDEPIAFTNEDALERLSGIAHAFLLHDREIRTRVDDSVARVMGGRPAVLRRARGFVPAPVRLSFEMPPILAAGADLKGAICLTRGRNAYLSQYLGDLEHALAHRAFEDAAEHLQELLGIRPEIIAHDLHPDYFSTRYAHSLSTLHSPLFAAVQHHHAHVASCMAENDLPNEKVIGIALDGTGFGPDGTVWGGEILLADYSGYERAAHFRSVPMPGGDAAAREPWRMAVAYLEAGGTRQEARIPLLSQIDPERIRTVREMIAKGINCPRTSSCGRLFDAVAALIELRTVNAFEGQAAMELEQIANENEEGRYRFTLDAGSIRNIDFSPMIADILEDVGRDVPATVIAARFHNTLVEALVGSCASILSDARYTMRDARVCLSGGCFQNALLTGRLKKQLEAEGFAVYTHSLVPPNDGGIALGQAVVAAHRHRT